LRRGFRTGRSETTAVRFPDFLRRLCDFRQMDFEAAFDQMLTLISFDPNRVHIFFSYRKQTKNQWARDDPAFVVVQGIFVALAALGYAIAFRHASLFSYAWTVLYCVVVDWLLLGMAIASTCRFVCCCVGNQAIVIAPLTDRPITFPPPLSPLNSYLANKYMRQYNSHAVEQEVEWLYAFDVHANAFFCSFLVTYVLQYFLLPLLLGRSFISCILSNTLYAVATAWYSYITYLGYTALPFLGHTQKFLWYPLVAIGIAWALSIVLLLFGIRFNTTRSVMVYHYG